MGINENFDVTITSRHEEIREDIKKSLTEQLWKLSKFHSHIIDAGIILDKRNSSLKVDITLRVPGAVITATEEGYKDKIILDSALEKIKTQLKKLKSKVADHRAIPISAIAESDVIEDADTIE